MAAGIYRRRLHDGTWRTRIADSQHILIYPRWPAVVFTGVKHISHHLAAARGLGSSLFLFFFFFLILINLRWIFYYPWGDVSSGHQEDRRDRWQECSRHQDPSTRPVSSFFLRGQHYVSRSFTGNMSSCVSITSLLSKIQGCVRPRGCVLKSM